MAHSPSPTNDNHALSDENPGTTAAIEPEEKANVNSEKQPSVGMLNLILGTGIGPFLCSLDSSIVNVSLVTIEESFDASMSRVQYCTLVYLLVLSCFLPVFGKLGDILDKKVVFQCGMVIFLIASLACGLAPSLYLLILFRAVQAVGACVILPCSMSLIAVFTNNKNRSVAFGWNTTIISAAIAVGPIAGGLLTQHLGWPSIFFVNLPIGLIGLVLVQWNIPNTKVFKEAAFDITGAILFFLSLLSLIVGTSEHESLGVYKTLILFACAILFFIAFLFREAHYFAPIVPVRMLLSQPFGFSFSAAFMLFFAYISVVFLMPFFYQEYLGYSPTMAGVFMLVAPVGLSVFGPLSGRISHRIDARYLTAFGSMIQSVGLFALVFSFPHIVPICISCLVVNIGMSICSVPDIDFIMACTPPSHLSVVSSLRHVVRNAAYTVGTAVVSSLFTTFKQNEHVEHSTDEGYYIALKHALLVFGGASLLATPLNLCRGHAKMLNLATQARANTAVGGKGEVEMQAVAIVDGHEKRQVDGELGEALLGADSRCSKHAGIDNTSSASSSSSALPPSSSCPATATARVDASAEQSGTARDGSDELPVPNGPLTALVTDSCLALSDMAPAVPQQELMRTRSQSLIERHSHSVNLPPE